MVVAKLDSIEVMPQNVIRHAIQEMRTTVINEMAEGDLERLHSIIFKSNTNPVVPRRSEDAYVRDGMIQLGRGNFGNVYEFIGSDGYKYAVKIARFESDNYSEHDAEILEKLQGIKGYPKLFSYTRGYSVENGAWGEYKNEFLIMVSKKIFGFTTRCGFDHHYCTKVFYDLCNDDVWKDYAETMRETIKLGYIPSDCHPDNVMIDAITGCATVVDVGCFRKIDEPLTQEEVDRRVDRYVRGSGLEKLCLTANSFNYENPKFTLEALT